MKKASRLGLLLLRGLMGGIRRVSKNTAMHYSVKTAKTARQFQVLEPIGEGVPNMRRAPSRALAVEAYSRVRE